MSQFYINSVKKRMKWQKLDLDNLQEEQISSSGGGATSPEEEILYEESAEREDAISELRKRLHDDFSHILDDNIDVSLNLNSNKQDNISNQESKESNFNSSELNEAVAVLSNIEDKVSLDNEEEQKSNNFDMKECYQIQVLFVVVVVPSSVAVVLKKHSTKAINFDHLDLQN